MIGSNQALQQHLGTIKEQTLRPDEQEIPPASSGVSVTPPMQPLWPDRPVLPPL
ncbi:MAG TPA: hypothetical protein VGN34_08625 [Ktedonobacteraceae bacterium]